MTTPNEVPTGKEGIVNKILSWLLLGTLLWLVIFGLWDHDWRMLVGSGLAAALWFWLMDDIMDGPSERRPYDQEERPPWE